jgi:hypothetical protein
MFTMLTGTGFLKREDVRIGQRVEIEAFCHIWGADTPTIVKKKPNKNLVRSASHIVGYEWRLIGGVVEAIDDAHIKLAIVPNSEGKRPHRGRFTSLNFFGWVVQDGEIHQRFRKVRAIRPL